MIALQVSGDAAVAEKLNDFPARLNVRLAGIMQAIGAALEDRVSDNLSGAVLNQRTGRLAAGISLEVSSNGDDVTTSLSVGDVPYAAYQEYGFQGTESVRAQLRTIKEAFGRAITPRQIAVRSFTRRVDYPAHSYLRSALAALAPDAVAQIDVAAGEEAAE